MKLKQRIYIASIIIVSFASAILGNFYSDISETIGLTRIFNFLLILALLFLGAYLGMKATN